MIKQFQAFLRQEWGSLLVICIAVVIQLYLVTRSLPFLITNVLPDDAFYYFDIARSIVLGTGSSFNGIDMTNGYHPLWLVVLLPIFKFFYTTASDITPIRIALIVAVVLNAITAIFVLRILTRFSNDSYVRALGMIVWLLNPFLLYESINGLETALTLCLFSVFFLLALRNEEGKSESYWMTGLVGGLMVLARLDMVFYLGAYLVWILFRRGWRIGLRPAFITGCIAAIPLIPWVIWNALNFHMILTGSSNAEVLVNHELIVQDHGTSVLQFLKAIVYLTQYSASALFDRTGMYALSFFGMGAAAVLIVRHEIKIPKRFSKMKLSQYMCGAFLMLFIADASIRWTVRPWYFVSFELLLAIGAVVALSAMKPYVNHYRTGVYILIGLILCSFFVDWSKNVRGAYHGQDQMYSTSLWMNEHLPSTTKIGIFNAGIEEYFSTRPIVNLDGLVNVNAYHAMQRRELWNYIQSQHIGYIADFDEYLTYRYKSFFGIDDPFANMTFTYTVDGLSTTTRSQNGVNIYKIK